MEISIEHLESPRSRDSDQPLTSNGVSRTDNNALRTFQSSMVLLANILIGTTMGASLIFAFNTGLPLNATRIHLILCVIGYQLLMAQAILSLSPANSWSSHLKFIEKRRAHWILQLLGSILAITGSFIKIMDKSVHWDTLHGKYALVALVFTSVCLVNGLASLWAYEIRRFIPGIVSKLTHICFGTVAFVASSIALCYGLEKNSFRQWATTPILYTLIAFVAIYTFIIIINPLVVFVMKLKDAVKS